MSLASPSDHGLQRIFQTAFMVRDVAEPLISFDETASAASVRDEMERRRFEVVGVRRHGIVSGYVNFEDLESGTCGSYCQPIDDTLTIADSTPLVELVLRLRERRRIFVTLLGQIGGIASRSDLHKPPLRMWLFGIVTLIEMRFNRMIARRCPDNSWKEFVSAGRLQKAVELYDERTRRNQDLELIDCLQLSDKLQIVAKNKELRTLTRFQSRRQMEDATKMIERLRNNLAHSQDIVSNDWETIVALSENIDNILEGPPGLDEREFQSDLQRE